MNNNIKLKKGQILIPNCTVLAPVWINNKLDWTDFVIYNKVIKFKKRSFFSKLVLNYDPNNQIEIILPNGTVGISLSSYWKLACSPAI